jgi:hypothetical protein
MISRDLLRKSERSCKVRDYCFISITCVKDDDYSCSGSELSIGGSCSELCGVQPSLGEEGFCISLAASEATPDWDIAGQGNFPIQGSFGIAFLDAQGLLVTPELFIVDGVMFLDGLAALELSVLRFGGDPLAFDGVSVQSVLELAELGLIEEDDILFVSEFEPGGRQFNFEVGVSGVPASELVLFAVGREEPVAVPASGSLGALALVLLLLGSGFVALRGRA